MFISDEAKGNTLIGEATINLIFNREEVTVNTLLRELKSMAESEDDENRLLLMHEVCRWLQGFCSLGSVKPERAGWLDSALKNGSMNNSVPFNRFTSSTKDEG
ncbi:hypothetical protein [Rouxiella chamberiensis]|uniref:Uncharacterized protein n=1 Tax=Rouxiella chamberiensis TaxID=1513468 RepID=A0ABY7HSY1_9GAMM|nr:hypothetical protein [Rouxiella chamberiensis]WAT02117.1 hypothetical protein O1V66_05480 [Rouxiella chamberiensis]